MADYRSVLANFAISIEHHRAASSSIEHKLVILLESRRLSLFFGKFLSSADQDRAAVSINCWISSNLGCFSLNLVVSGRVSDQHRAAPSRIEHRSLNLAVSL
jgi:hypothetical protein